MLCVHTCNSAHLNIRFVKGKLSIGIRNCQRVTAGQALLLKGMKVVDVTDHDWCEHTHLLYMIIYSF